MTDQPSGYTWFTAFVRMTGEQSNAFLALLYQLRKILEEFASPDGNVVILWANSIYRPGTTNLQRLPDCLLKLQAYCDAHGGDPAGFMYLPETVKWWAGKATPFKAYAKQNCRVWKLPAAEPVTVGIVDQPDTYPVWKYEPAGYEMDVSLVLETESAPTWFIVAQGGGYKWVCLAAETQAIP